MHIVLIIIVLLLLVGLILGPSWWVQRVLKQYNQPRQDYPGNGGEFAQHLVRRLALDGVKVEASEQGDHYDPDDRAVRLAMDKMQQRSLTAVVVAAHEVGHALQHQIGYRPFVWRQRLALTAAMAQRVGVVLIMAMPVMTVLFRHPLAGWVTVVAGLLVMGSAVLIHLVTLPVEWDASFRRALPILEAGRYLHPSDYPAARKILRAAALTYVAAALASLLNLWRWAAILRR